MRTLAVRGRGFETPFPVQSRYRPGSRIAILKPAAFWWISRGMSKTCRKKGVCGGTGMTCPVRPGGYRRLFAESTRAAWRLSMAISQERSGGRGNIAETSVVPIALLFVLQAGCAKLDVSDRMCRNRATCPAGPTESRQCVRDPHPFRQRSGHQILSGRYPDRRQRTFCRKGHREWRRP